MFRAQPNVDVCDAILVRRKPLLHRLYYHFLFYMLCRFSTQNLLTEMRHIEFKLSMTESLIRLS